MVKLSKIFEFANRHGGLQAFLVFAIIILIASVLSINHVVFGEEAGAQNEGGFAIEAKKINPDINIIDKKRKINENIDIKIKDKNKNILKRKTGKANDGVLISRGLYDIEINISNTPVKKIEFSDVLMDRELFNLGIDDVPESIQKIDDKKPWREVYAIDPTELSFANATVTAVAKGNSLYKCRDWNFAAQSCLGEWEFFKNIIPGREYNFTLTADDPGFGEINATEALHLDENYTIISNIYDKVKAKDGIWSEPIYKNEIVRATFESNLTNGSVIDIYVRSNSTIAYFDVYEAGTQHKAASSAATEYPETQYMIISGLTKPTSMFDFKIVKVYPDANETDNTTNIDPNVLSFLEFDYIHDDAINGAQADGLIAYSENNANALRYRIWNSSNDFSIENVDANSVNASIKWVAARAGHERDEIIMGAEDSDKDINIQIYNSSKAWNALLEASTDIQSHLYRSFDIAYEDISGGALIVYELNETNDNVVAYRIWNGTAYSAESRLAMNLTNNGTARWIALIQKKGSDNIMLLAQTNGGSSKKELYAVPWNGTNFDSLRGASLSPDTTSSIEQHFGFAWEELSGDGIAGYGTGTNFAYRTYDYDNPSQNYWGAENTIDSGNGLDGLRMCSDTFSDYIGIIWQDGGNDVQARMWNGDAMLPSPPSGDNDIEPNGNNNINVDCAWLNTGTALFGFVDNDALNIDYFTFTKATSAWSTSDLTSTSSSQNFSTDDIASLRFTKHPVSDEIMAVAMDIAEDITAIRWNGTGFALISASPLEGVSEVTNGDQEGAMFDWHRYDTFPVVANLTANGTSYAANSTVSIGVNAIDNVNISAVYGTIRFPNSTTMRISFTSLGNNYYVYNFTQTSSIGVYNITITANDTSTHNNTNSSEKGWFFINTTAINDTINPSVYNITPDNSTYNISDIISITANVSDNINISTVRANISIPNDSSAWLVLNDADLNGIYNNTYTIPTAIGRYNITIFANDTFGNINSTEKGFFTAINSTPIANQTGGNQTNQTETPSTPPSSSSSSGSSRSGNKKGVFSGERGAAPAAGSVNTPSASSVTEKSINLMLGGSLTFPIEIANIFKDVVLRDVKIDVEGDAASYLQSTPELLKEILPGKIRIFSLKFAHPVMSEPGKKEIMLAITGKAVKNVNGKETADNYLEKRKIILNFVRVSAEKAQEIFANIGAIQKEMEQKNFPLGRINILLKEANDAFASSQFDDMVEIESEAERVSGLAEEVNKRIGGLKERINAAKKQEMETEKLEELLLLAENEFAVENYESALDSLIAAEETSAGMKESKIGAVFGMLALAAALSILIVLISRFGRGKNKFRALYTGFSISFGKKLKKIAVQQKNDDRDKNKPEEELEEKSETEKETEQRTEEISEELEEEAEEPENELEEKSETEKETDAKKSVILSQLKEAINNNADDEKAAALPKQEKEKASESAEKKQPQQEHAVYGKDADETNAYAKVLGRHLMQSRKPVQKDRRKMIFWPMAKKPSGLESAVIKLERDGFKVVRK